VEVNFPGNGLTSVVGPNGCGKSNIVDAIRWVMGEQRAKQLRSSKMEDVIFSGTEDRPALNMAEVSLIINNDKGLLPSEYSEIQITRRAYRNGDSEYLINNQECRLKDIQNLFFDTGMGAASYSLMEQRMIDSILSDKAEERRALFEEASGISRYKQQRKETLRQLDRTRLDMERVEDNLRITRQSVRSFERQAKKAEEFHRLRNSLRGLEISLNYDRYCEFRENFLRLKEQWEQKNVSSEEAQTRLTTLETILAERRLSISDEEEAFRELDRQVMEQNMDINDLNNEMQRRRDRLNYLQSQVEAWQQEVAGAGDRLEDLRNGEEKLRQEYEELQDALESTQEGFSGLAEKRTVMREQFEDARDERRTLEKERMEAVDLYSRLLNEAERSNERLRALEEQSQRLEQEQSVLRNNLQNYESELAELDARWEKEEGQSSGLEEQGRSVAARLEELKEELQGVEQQDRDVQRKLVSARSRLDVLQKMIASGEGAAEGVRRVLNQAQDKVQGILADHIDVPPEYAGALGRVLEEYFQMVLVQDTESLQDLLNLLAGEGGSQADFALLQFPGQTGNGDQQTASNPDLGNAHVVARGEDIVKQHQGAAAQQGLESLLRKWFSTVVLVQDLQTALELAAKNAGGAEYWFVTAEGTAVSSTGKVRSAASTSTAAHLLNRTQELEKLTAECAELETQANALSAKREEKEPLMQELSLQRDSLREEWSTARQARMELESSRRIAQSRVDDLRSRLSDMDERHKRIEEERAEQISKQPDDGGQLEEARQKREELEDRYREISEKAAELESQWEALNEEFMDAERGLSGDRQRIVQIEQELQYRRQQYDNLTEMVQNRKQQIEASAEERELLQESLQEEENKLETLQEQLSVIEGRRDEAKSVYDSRMADLDEQRTEISELNRQLRSMGDERHEIEMKMEAQRSNGEHIKELMFNQWEVDLDDKESLPLIEYDLQSAEKEVRSLKAEVRKLGNVNTGALEDYEEEKKRLENVEQQFEDLDKARLSLERTIQKLDKIARERFHETFRQIQRNFQEVFSSLMVGGEARLNLEDGVDPLEGRIEINARPTGKKMRGVALLSGGERALTATSLLFALYMVKPSPYCILDEVDGPLDDANIGRFVQLLRRFSRQTQFIVVTHNKRTMAASDRLYGVTQEIKGISRIASVQLDEAADIVG